MRALTLLFAVLALSGCISSRPIIMRNSLTGQTTDCGSHNQTFQWQVDSNPYREESCVLDHEAHGWVRSSN
jgi:hypothetical protein